MDPLRHGALLAGTAARCPVPIGSPFSDVARGVFTAPPAAAIGAAMADSLLLELADFEHMVHTGIYSEETGRPQPLRFSVGVKLKPIPRYDAETSLDASKN